MKTIIIIKNICICVLLVIIFITLYSMYNKITELEISNMMASFVGSIVGIYLTTKTLYEIYTLND